MAKQWYRKVMGTEIGPLTSQEILELARSGHLAPEDPIRLEGSDRWVSAVNVKGLFSRHSDGLTETNHPAADAQQEGVPDHVGDEPQPGARNTATTLSSNRPTIQSATPYISNNLVAGEKIEYIARIHPAIFLPSLVAAVAFLAATLTVFTFFSSLTIVPTLVCSLIGGFWSANLAAKALVVYATTECVVTNQRVMGKIGLLNRRSLAILIDKVEGLHVRQGILGRVFDYGTVTVTGTGRTAISFRGVAQPLEFRRHVQQRARPDERNGPTR